MEEKQQLEEANKEVEQYRQEVGLLGLRQELEAKQLSLYGVELRTAAETDEEGNLQAGAEQIRVARFQEALIPQQAQVEKSIQTDEEQLVLIDGLLGQLEDNGIWVGDVALRGEDGAAPESLGYRGSSWCVYGRLCPHCPSARHFEWSRTLQSSGAGSFRRRTG